MRVIRSVMLAAILLLPRSAGAWSTELGQSPLQFPPAVDAARLPDGNVVVTDGAGFRLVALSAASGEVRWTYDRGTGAAAAVSVDGAGDVVAAGWTVFGFGEQQLTVVKIDGTTGQERWR